jgi:hypothetical protein
MEVQVRKAEHELGLKDEAPTHVKMFNSPIKSCYDFILHHYEIKSEILSARRKM